MTRAKHKSIPKSLKKTMRWLEKKGIKIVIGLSESARHSYPPGVCRIVRETEPGFKVIAYTGNGIMNLFLVVDAQDLTLREAIKAYLNHASQ